MDTAESSVETGRVQLVCHRNPDAFVVFVVGLGSTVRHIHTQSQLYDKIAIDKYLTVPPRSSGLTQSVCLSHGCELRRGETERATGNVAACVTVPHRALTAPRRVASLKSLSRARARAPPLSLSLRAPPPGCSALARSLSSSGARALPPPRRQPADSPAPAERTSRRGSSSSNAVWRERKSVC